MPFKIQSRSGLFAAAVDCWRWRRICEYDDFILGPELRETIMDFRWVSAASPGGHDVQSWTITSVASDLESRLVEDSIPIPKLIGSFSLMLKI